MVLEEVRLARRFFRGLGVRGTGGEIAARAVAGDGEQPCGEAVAVLEGNERAEAADERLLHDVVRLVRVQLGKAGGETRYGGTVAAVEVLLGCLAPRATGEDAADQRGVLHAPVEERQVWADGRGGELSSRSVRGKGHALLAVRVPMPWRLCPPSDFASLSDS